MKWNVNDIYEFTKKLTRKNQSGGISPTDLFYTWNAEQNNYHSDLLGRWQLNSNGKTGANTGLILNETIQQKLAAFTIEGSITITDGVATKPEDFIFELALRIGNNKVDKINHEQKYWVAGSVIDPPSISGSTYYCVEYEDSYSFLPSTTSGTLSLDYIAAVTDILWGYTLDTNDRPVYNPGTSVQPKWNQPVIVEITKRTLKTLGVSFKDTDFTQSGQASIITGN